MKINAKDIAKELNISAAAVSLALNGKKGVSEITREKIIAKAKEMGFDFSSLVRSPKDKINILFLIYARTGAVVADTQFFASVTEGISIRCQERKLNLEVRYIYENDNLADEIYSIIKTDTSGIILLGTEMTPVRFRPFQKLSIPLLILDTYFEEINGNYCLINNVQGAFIATNYIIRKKKQQPGHLKSAYDIGNFKEREDGFYNAIRANGMSASKSIVHHLAPSTEGAYEDMKNILQRGDAIASCYFADNDLIACGAMKAFKEAGYRIPEDIGIVGFDNIVLSEMMDPPLTTINVPKLNMGKNAVDRLIVMMSPDSGSPVKIEISTDLVIRKSL